MKEENATHHPLDAPTRDELARIVEEVKAARDAQPFDPQRWFAACREYDEQFDADTGGYETVLALLASVRGAEADTAKVTRFEVIDHRENPGYYRRSFVARPCRVELSYQDDRRTLKVFVNDAARAHPSTQEPADVE